MRTKVGTESVWGKAYFDYYKRTDRSPPPLGTTCDLRNVLIHQFFYWCITHRSFGTRVNPWLFFAVGFFALAAAIAPELASWIFLTVILSSTVIALAILADKIEVEDRLENLLEKPLYIIANRIQIWNERLWAIRFLNRRIAWVIIVFLLSLIQVHAYISYATSRSVWSFMIFLLMAAVETVPVCLFTVAFVMALDDEFDISEKFASLRRSKSLGGATRQQEQKPKGFYKLLIDFGICKYIDWVE